MNKKKILGFAVGPVMGGAISFVLLPLMAWYFPLEDIGRSNILQIFISFSILMFVLGLDQAYVREFHETKDRFGLFKACFVPGFILLLASLVISLPYAREIAKVLYGVSNPMWYFMTAFCVIFSFTARFFSLIVRMQERGLAYSASQVLAKLVMIVMLIAYIMLEVESNYSNLLYANLFSLILVVLVFGWNIRVDWIPTAKARIDRSELKKILNFGAPLILAGVAYWGLSAVSTVALRTFSDFKELGIYSMAMSFAGVATVFQSIFSTIWMPTVYKWVAENKDLTKIDLVTQYVLIAICLIFCFAGMFSWLIDYVLPENYAQVKYIVACCMVQPLLYTLSETTVVGLNVQRKSMHALGIAVVALVCNAMFSFALIPRFGAAGAAVSNALAYLIFFVVRTEVSARLWRPMPKMRLYLMTSTMVVASISMAMSTRSAEIVFWWMWAGLTVILIWMFRDELKSAMVEFWPISLRHKSIK
jgi:O-antigen/teichoic acid export membrane protein